MMKLDEPLLSAREIAETIRRHTNYVYAMRRQGFKMPGGRATLTSAMQWLCKHPAPRGIVRNR